MPTTPKTPPLPTTEATLAAGKISKAELLAVESEY
jgi:hypothetical protein